MKIKVIATHYIEAQTWVEAEKQVEQHLSNPDGIESEPAGNDPRDMIAFGISDKIYEKHNKLFYDPFANEEYSENVEELKQKVMNWIENIVDDIIKTNEEEWS